MKLLNEFFGSFGYTMDNPHPAGRYAAWGKGGEFYRKEYAPQF